MESATSAAPSMDGSGNDELHSEYRAHSISYLREAEDQMAVPSLFDLLDMEQDGVRERAA